MGRPNKALKNQAAKPGANGVFIHEPGKTRTYTAYRCAWGIPFVFPQKEGKMSEGAIFVSEE